MIPTGKAIRSALIAGVAGAVLLPAGAIAQSYYDRSMRTDPGYDRPYYSDRYDRDRFADRDRFSDRNRFDAARYDSDRIYREAYDRAYRDAYDRAYRDARDRDRFADRAYDRDRFSDRSYSSHGYVGPDRDFYDRDYQRWRQEQAERMDREYRAWADRRWDQEAASTPDQSGVGSTTGSATTGRVTGDNPTSN